MRQAINIIRSKKQTRSPNNTTKQTLAKTNKTPPVCQWKDFSLHKQKYFTILCLSRENILWSCLISLSMSDQTQVCINAFPCRAVKDEATIGALTAAICQYLQTAIEMGFGGVRGRVSCQNEVNSLVFKLLLYSRNTLFFWLYTGIG